jgi:hypothetical protein
LTYAKFWERADLSGSEIRSQIRAFMFQYLWETFFAKPCFGLGNPEGLELGLTRFELALKEQNGGEIPFRFHQQLSLM